jgi:serine/threonine protein kinase
MSSLRASTPLGPSMDDHREESPPATVPACGAPPRPSASPLPRVQGYEVMHVLGHGGMSTVYLASQTKLKRRVAIKMLRVGDWNDAEPRERFRREAEAIATLQHANIVQIIEVGEVDGTPFLVLEYVSGGTLHKLIAGRPLPVRAAARIVEQLAQAVQAAHDRDIIHRDLKPANILMAGGAHRHAHDDVLGAEREDGAAPRAGEGDARGAFLESRCPKITDFGLARQLGQAARQTQSGQAIGTPSYMAPEQAAGKTQEVGKLSDVYGLGTILYEALTGRPPFECDSPLETMLMVRREEPAPPSRSNRKVPRDLETICLKCLEKTPARRYGSARELALDLERFLNGQPVLARPLGKLARLVKWARRRPSGAIAVAAGLLLFVGLIAYLITVQSLYSQLKSSNAQLETKTRQLEALSQREKDRNRDLRDLLDSPEIDTDKWLKHAASGPDDVWAQLRAFDALMSADKPEEARRYLDRAMQLAVEATRRAEASFTEWNDLAKVHDRASELFKSLNDANGSWQAQSASLQLRRWLHQNDAVTLRWGIDLSVSLQKMARLHLERHRVDDDRAAGALLHEALDLLFEVPESKEVIDARAVVHELLADFFERTGDAEKADEHGARAGDLRARLNQGRPKGKAAQPPAS